MSSIFLSEFISVIVPDPVSFLWILVPATDAAAVNANGFQKYLANNRKTC